MGIVTLSFLLLSLYACFLLHGLSKPDLPLGFQFSIPVPPAYDSGFRGKAFVLEDGRSATSFRAALSLEATGGKYFCFLAVFLGDLKVWDSHRFSRFDPSESCVLELTADGDLLLKDQAGRIGWQTGTSGQGVEKLVLLKTGNLVLINAENNTKWQSFDFPTDIILWNQRLDVPARLTSFQNDSSASYSLDIARDKLSLYLKWDNIDYSYWEFKPRHHKNISFVKLGSRGLKLFDWNSRKIAQIVATGAGSVRFLALGRTGNLGLYYYSAYKGVFEPSFQALDELCDLPLPCGHYGICSFPDACACFHTSSIRQHVTAPNCDSFLGNGFCVGKASTQMVEVPGADTVLRTASPRINVSKDECTSSCMENCSCAAALYSDGSGVGFQRACFHYGLVGGVRQIEESGLSYWLKVPAETMEHQGRSSSIKKKILIVAGVADGLGVCLILGGLMYYFLRIRNRRNNSRADTN